MVAAAAVIVATVIVAALSQDRTKLVPPAHWFVYTYPSAMVDCCGTVVVAVFITSF